jgi:GTP-binding protein
MRSSTGDDFQHLVPPRQLSLEQSLEFCREDECVEVTPTKVRIRKVILSQTDREKNRGRRAKS